MEPKTYLTKEEKEIDFVIGVVGFPALNAVLYYLLQLAQIGDAALILPWVFNVGLFLIFVWWRPWIAVGALAFPVLVVVAALLTGIFAFLCCMVVFTAGCLFGL